MLLLLHDSENIIPQERVAAYNAEHVANYTLDSFPQEHQLHILATHGTFCGIKRFTASGSMRVVARVAVACCMIHAAFARGIELGLRD